MTVTVDATSSVASNGTGTSLAFSHTVSGSNRGLIVAVSCTSQNLPSSVAYNGVAMTQVGAAQETPTGRRVSLWRLLNPSLGSNTVLISFAVSVAAVAAATSFNGVDPVAMTGTFVSAQGTDTAPTVTVDAVAGDMVIDTVSWVGGTATVGIGQTQRWNMTGVNSSGCGSVEAGVPGTVMNWTLSQAANWVTCGVAVKAPIAPSVPSPAKILTPLIRSNKGIMSYAGFISGPVADNAPLPVPSEFVSSCPMG